MKKYLTLLFIIIQITVFSQMELLRYDAIRLCDSVHVVDYKIRPHIHDLSNYKDSLKIKVRLYENCGLDLKQGALMVENDTLILMWTENNTPIEKEGVVYEKGTWFNKDSLQVRSYLACDCYMELTYVIKGLDIIKPLKIFNRNVFQRDSMYRLFNPTFQIYEGDTINYTDSIGVQKGKWIEFDSLGRVAMIEIIIDELFTEEFENFEYHENGEIATHFLARRTKNGFVMEEKYYQNGQLKERFFSSDIILDHEHDYFNVSYKEYFDEEGELIKRELLDVDNNLYEYGYFYE